MQKRKLLELTFVFVFFSILVTLINLNCQDFFMDRIWVVHMLQKISEGDLIYTDINVIVGPIFYLVGGLVFKIFGSSFVVYDIFSGICYGFLACMIYSIIKEINKHDNKIITVVSLLIIYCFTNFLAYANYNSFAIFFIMCAMLIEIRKAKDKSNKYSNLLIGIFLGLAFFSKQTIGGMAVIATGLMSLIDVLILKKQNPIKEILEKALGFLIVLILIGTSMIIAGNFMDYINLAFGSIIEFGGNNLSFSDVTFYIVAMFGILLGGILLCKEKKEDREFLVITLYSIAMAFFMIPIFNMYHTHIATLFIWFLVIKFLNIFTENKSESFFKLFIVIPLTLFIISMNTGSDTGAYASMELGKFALNLAIDIVDIAIICALGIVLIKNDVEKTKKIFGICAFMLLILLVSKYVLGLRYNQVPEGLELYANHGFDSEKLDEISNVINYIENKEEEGYKVYVVSHDASEYMAPMKRNNGKFDLLLYGNLGYNGVKNVLEEIKEMENTLFLKNKEDFWQQPKEVMSYIKQNCELIDEIENLEVYYKEFAN